MFSADESLKTDLIDHILMLLTIRGIKTQKQVTTQKTHEDKVFVLSSKVVVHKVDDQFGEIVKKYSLQRLKEENRKTRGNTNELAKKHVYDEELIRDFIDLMPLPESFEAKLKNEIFQYDKERVYNLIQQAIDLFEITPTLIKLRSPIKIFGSIDGQYNDLIRYFNFWGRPSEHKGDIESFEYLFLGNITNRGSLSLETLCLLLALKVLIRIFKF